jgi:hypothetical protein
LTHEGPCIPLYGVSTGFVPRLVGQKVLLNRSLRESVNSTDVVQVTVSIPPP